MTTCKPWITDNGIDIEIFLREHSAELARLPSNQIGLSGESTTDIDGLPPVENRLRRAEIYLSRMPGAIMGQRGSSVTYSAACALVHGFALGTSDALALLKRIHNPLCKPEWSDEELYHKVVDAAEKTHSKEYGYLAKVPPNNSPPEEIILAPGVNILGLGGVGQSMLAATPADAIPVESVPDIHPSLVDPQGVREEIDNPARLARHFLRDAFQYRAKLTLRYYHDSYYIWNGGAWDSIASDVVKSAMLKYCRQTFERSARAAADIARSENKPIPAVAKVTSALITNCMMHVQQLAYLQGDAIPNDPPAWIGGIDIANVNNLLASSAGLYDLVDNRRWDPTPDYFNFTSVDYKPDFDSHPVEWLAFLRSIWGDDQDSINLLQEWLGYLLIVDNSQQKMLMMVGPPRSGKGTILGIIRQLVGLKNCAGITMSGLSDDFGLSYLLQKTVAIFDDARMSKSTDAQVAIERMLAISGGGSLVVNRKHRDAIESQINCRFVLATNEIPRLADNSGAFAKRWCILQFPNSFIGREDIGLSERLRKEIPSICGWAVKGIDRLRSNRRFTVPESSAETTEMLMESVSPIADFIKECCTLSSIARTDIDDLYRAWQNYVADEGIDWKMSKVDFCRKLSSATPGLTRKRQNTPNGGKITVVLGIELQ